MVAQVSSAADFEKALSDDKLVVVDFFATWCGPCKMIAPMIEKFATEYAGKATFYKVDVDEVPDVAKNNDISAMPTLVFFKGGKEVARVLGANLAAIKQNIASNI
ncbi:Thioredoxin [Kluyveromyces marxianus]|uniref:Thioredoxin n=1 Tax=Kluyveromyces marxianus (strain DMKU3-1042 / BCC 29191 / NBRC 104275) TaxID=1003335 RepID=W0TE88_KLUMD|nr:thioredoxin-2 [Kluyveromyces marxianus DMKU3-1042]KAG0673374.1 Cytoplasmic thioredoxin isoenzyme 2 [Kluyveromyces marxianus]KAG0685576.1 Cytoplasmic thioredoxin isoenzyme 2 [Kluyveromyces marxianus]BAO41368.1 thioredoxin-2 [Kluyveromyces marxianus DMKU3-1042]